jgi:hypothetical protein
VSAFIQPGYAFITEPSDAALRRPIAPTALHTATEILVNSPVIDADVLASFEVLTPKLDEQSSVLNQLSVSRTKLVRTAYIPSNGSVDALFRNPMLLNLFLEGNYTIIMSLSPLHPPK